MKVQYYLASSLDGYIARPDDSLGWLMQFGDVANTSYPSFIKDVGALVMGSVTYEWIVKNLMAAPDAKWPYESPAWVLTSRELTAPAGADVRFTRGDVRSAFDAIRESASGKNVWVVGGGELAGQFYDAGLLDEIIVQVTPVTLTAGKPLLPREIVSPPLKLQSVERWGEFAEMRYEVPRPA